jgi:hypothetical protein
LNRPNSAPTKQADTQVINETKTVPKKINKPLEYKDTLMGLGPGADEDSLGAEATTRFLKAKVHVLQQELDKFVSEKKKNV